MVVPQPLVIIKFYIINGCGLSNKATTINSKWCINSVQLRVWLFAKADWFCFSGEQNYVTNAPLQNHHYNKLRSNRKL